jgi:AraC-like DNA-binding protein
MMSETFRRETGLTPGDYRRRVRSLVGEDG